MARKDTPRANEDEAPPSPETVHDVSAEKRAPYLQPGPSGTELLLVSKTREASANFKRAQQAEQAYRSRRRADGAKAQRKNVKIHFKQSAHHFKEGVKALGYSITAVPHVLKAKRHERKAKMDAKKREKDVQKRQRLDERLRQLQLEEAEAEKDRQKEKE